MSETEFFLNLAVLGVALLLSGPVALAIVVHLRGRIATLERKLAHLEHLQGSQPTPLEQRSEVGPTRETGWAPQAVLASEPSQEEHPAGRTAITPAIPAVEVPPQKSRPSIEERFGTRWTVWVGGIALAFGAALLARYSLEQGYFGPKMRIAASFALAVALIAAGEALRRRLRGQAPVPPNWPDIPAMVTAAGTIALFGAIYAAYAIYDFISPTTAFAALGMTGIATMVAALLHGPVLAGFGLVGALATPLLIGSSDGNPWAMTLYLPIVAASAYSFAWTKGWRALAFAAAIGSGLWALLLGGLADDPNSVAAALAHAVLQAGLASYIFAILPNSSLADEEARPDRLGTGLLLTATLVLLAVLAFTIGTDYGTAWILAVAAAILIPAVVGFLSRPLAGGLLVAGLALCIIIVLWPPDFGPDWTYLPIWPETRDGSLLLTIAGIGASGISALGALRLLAGSRLPKATAWLYAAGSALPPLAALALTYLRFSQGEAAPSFAVAAGVLALAATGLAALFRNQNESTPTEALKLGLGAYASAAVASLSLGLVFGVTGGSLTVAMALTALGTAVIARRLDIPALRWCVAGLGAVVAVRLAWDPAIVGPDLGTTPILNWLLVGYGVPALCFGIAAVLIRLPGVRPDAPVLIAQALSILLAAFLVFFEIRHALNDGDIFAEHTGVLEQGLMAFSALLFAIVMVRLDALHSSPVIRVASLAFGVLALGQSLVGLGLIGNPYLTNEPVGGGKLFNEITLAYGLPTIAAFVLARAAEANRPLWYVRAAGLLATILGFVGLTLMIRHAFQGEHLGMFRATSDGEWYAYSAGWLVLGLVFLAYGVLRGSHMARLASAALVCVTTLKVFLFDLSGLDGPLRALSFLGLGAVLIGIGFVYQRFVFAGRRVGEPA